MSNEYTVVSQVKLLRWDQATQTSIEGWNITVTWARSGTTFTVFVPGDAPPPAEVDAAVRTVGYNTEQIAALGTPAPKG